MTPRDYLTSISTLTAAGIRRVFFTGGEPLLSPAARPVLEGLPAHRMSDSTTLITNGLTLTKDLDWLATTALDRVKVSLHYFSDASIAGIAEGRPGDIAKIKAGIEAAIGVIPVVELNLLLQEQNAHEVMDIIAYARDLGTGLQIIELVGTDYNDGLGGRKVLLPAGAAREVNEELGITIHPGDLTFAHLCHHADPDRQARIGVFFAATRWTGQPTNAEPGKCAKIDWFDLDDLPDDLVSYARGGIQAHRRGQTFSLDNWP